MCGSDTSMCLYMHAEAEAEAFSLPSILRVLSVRSLPEPGACI